VGQTQKVEAVAAAAQEGEAQVVPLLPHAVR